MEATHELADCVSLRPPRLTNLEMAITCWMAMDLCDRQLFSMESSGRGDAVSPCWMQGWRSSLSLQASDRPRPDQRLYRIRSTALMVMSLKAATDTSH